MDNSLDKIQPPYMYWEGKARKIHSDLFKADWEWPPAEEEEPKIPEGTPSRRVLIWNFWAWRAFLKLSEEERQVLIATLAATIKTHKFGEPIKFCVGFGLRLSWEILPPHVESVE